MRFVLFVLNKHLSFCFYLLVSILCFLCVWNLFVKKKRVKITLITSFILLLKALRIVYSDHKTSFLELLKIDKSVTIHQKSCNVYLLKSIKLKMASRQNEIFKFLKILSMNLEVVSIYQTKTHVQFSSVLNP